MLELITFPLFIAICGFVWTAAIVGPGEVLAFLPKLYWKVFGVGALSAYFGKMLWQCEKCAAGQIALWYCVYFRLDIHEWILNIVLSIFFAAFIGRIYKWLK